MNREIQEKRAFDKIKAEKKRRIAISIYGRDYYPNYNQYTKGKIHCGCPLCSTKTKVKGRKAWLSHRDMQSNAKMEMDFSDLIVV